MFFIPVTCGRWSCPDCCEHKARKYAAKIHRAHPERAMTLTWHTAVSHDRHYALTKMNKALPRFITRLRKLGYKIEYVRLWDVHKSGMPHIHLATWGDFIPKETLSREWKKQTGAYVVDIHTLNDHTKHRHNWVMYLKKAHRFPNSLFKKMRRVSFSRGYHRNPSDYQADVVYADEKVRATKLSVEESLAVLLSLAVWTMEKERGNLAFIFKPDKAFTGDTILYEKLEAVMGGLPSIRG